MRRSTGLAKWILEEARTIEEAGLTPRLFANIFAMIIGGLGVIANCLVWYWSLQRPANSPRPAVFFAIMVLALVLPFIAAWRSSKLWLLLYLSPLILWGYEMTHIR